jgi:secretion/DNA translocation related TadE-like protein
VCGGLSRLLVDQRRVSTAADLAALSGAGAVQAGRDPCPAARATAARNGAELADCRVTGERVAVTAQLPSPGMGGLLGLMGRSVSIEAKAVAGPVAGPVEGPVS